MLTNGKGLYFSEDKLRGVFIAPFGIAIYEATANDEDIYTYTHKGVVCDRDLAYKWIDDGVMPETINVHDVKIINHS